MSGTPKHTPPQPQAAAVLASARPAFLGIALISGVVNILTLTAPLFMLQVYDRVLTSRSLPTLAGLAVLALMLYAFQAMLDIVRARALLRIGEVFDGRLSAHVHQAVMWLPLQMRVPGDGMQPLRDLDNLRGFFSSQGPTVFFDLPWLPFYLGICFLFHFWIGVTALIGAVALGLLAVLTDALSRGPTQEAVRHGMVRNARMDAARRNAEIIRAMGLEQRMTARWGLVNSHYLASNRYAGDIASVLGGISRALRISLQSAILGVGAWLVIRQQVSVGVMIASSIMMGRALAPVDLAIGSWRTCLLAWQSWTRLKELLALIAEPEDVTALPRPETDLRAEAVTIIPPGAKMPTVVDVSFTVPAGSALGIIGPSGSGKSTVARVLAGAWRSARGAVRIDGASFDRWDRETLGRHIGYLPQGVDLFDGTVADNIARFEADPDPEMIIAAAKAAGIHDLILRFEKGYETPVGEGGSSLSAGQRQRLGLARALYGEPFLVILDEPNANLDAEGEAALLRAIVSIRERKGIVILIAHRPGALTAVDLVLMMDGGRCKAFGPRDDVLSKVLKAPKGSVSPAATQGYGPNARMANAFRVIANPAAEGTEDPIMRGRDAEKPFEAQDDA